MALINGKTFLDGRMLLTYNWTKIISGVLGYVTLLTTENGTDLLLTICLVWQGLKHLLFVNSY